MKFMTLDFPGNSWIWDRNSHEIQEFGVGFSMKFLNLELDFPGNVWIFQEIPGFGFSMEFLVLKKRNERGENLGMRGAKNPGMRENLGSERGKKIWE